jgi:hypothetical protein
MNTMKDLHVNRRIILKWILNKMWAWTGLFWLRTGTSGELL